MGSSITFAGHEIEDSIDLYVGLSPSVEARVTIQINVRNETPAPFEEMASREPTVRELDAISAILANHDWRLIPMLTSTRRPKPARASARSEDLKTL